MKLRFRRYDFSFMDEPVWATSEQDSDKNSYVFANAIEECLKDAFGFSHLFVKEIKEHGNQRLERRTTGVQQN